MRCRPSVEFRKLLTSSMPVQPQINTQPYRLLRLFANAAIVYPVVLIGLLYVEWLLAWHLIGHRPQWSVDDPKDIGGTVWLHLIIQFMLYAHVPAGILAVTLNVAYVVLGRPSAPQAGIRALTLTSLWLA